MTTRILVAEDNDNLAQTLARFLATKGFGVQVASSGADVLPLVSSFMPHLLLLDLRLPVLSGPEILHKIRQSGSSLPIIVMSGIYKGEQYRNEMLKLGVTHYLEKPFTPQVLFDAINDLLGKAAPTPAQPAASTTQPTRQEPAPVTPPAAQQSRRPPISQIYDRSLTGLLSSGNGSPMVFVKGEPVSFLSRGREDFPAFLVERGKISLADMRQIVSQQVERLFLTQTGILTYDSLVEESRLFLMKRLVELWQQPASEFQEGFSDIEMPITPLALPQFIYQVYREGHMALDGPFGTSTAGSLFPAFTTSYFRKINFIALQGQDIEGLAKIDGKTSLKDLASESKSARFYQFLHDFGMIALHSSPTGNASADFPQKTLFNAPVEEEIMAAVEDTVGFEDLVEEVSESVNLSVAPKVDATLTSDEISFEQSVLRDHAFLKGKNYYEIFGLTRNSFTFDKLKEAYFKKSKEYGPEKFMMLSGSTMGIAQEILSTLSTAYNTLSNVVSKERYDEMLNADTVGLDGKQDDKLQAQVQLQSGKVFLDMHEFENAQKALQDAFTLNQNNYEACAYLAWAIYRNPVNKGSKAAREKAKSLLSKSLQIKANAEAYAFRGAMLVDEGREELAEGEFQKALKLNPKEPTARKGMAHITEKREAENKGIFKKFFG